MPIKLLLFALVAEAGAYLTLGLSHQKIMPKPGASKHNYKGTKLSSPSALFDVANIDVFKGVSEVDRGDNVTIAGLYVKRLAALLHVCAVDTAAMADINAVVLQDMYDKLRGL